jgi:hypothetical protein
MNGNTAGRREGSTSSWVWIAGAIGTAAGVATVIYRETQRSPWEKARRKVVHVAETARSEAQPWMGVAAGVVAGSAALAYWLKPQPSGWELARRRTQQIARQTRREMQPWISLAASTAVSLISAAYSRSQQATESASKGVSMSGDQLAAAGLQLLRRVQHISGETRKLYPQVKKLIA